MVPDWFGSILTRQITEKTELASLCTALISTSCATRDGAVAKKHTENVQRLRASYQCRSYAALKATTSTRARRSTPTERGSPAPAARCDFLLIFYCFSIDFRLFPDCFRLILSAAASILLPMTSKATPLIVATSQQTSAPKTCSSTICHHSMTASRPPMQCT